MKKQLSGPMPKLRKIPLIANSPLGSARSGSFEIEVIPSDRLFDELGNTTYDLLDAVSELIDNSIAAAPEGRPYKIQLTFSHSRKPSSDRFEIADDCLGIPRAELGSAISPAALAGIGLNEHGLGLKQAVASIGTLESFVTRSTTEAAGTEINRFSWKLKAKIRPRAEVGTTIKIGHLVQPVIRGAEKQKIFAAELGARYRRFLEEESRLSLIVQFSDVDKEQNRVYPVQAVKPVYFNLSTRNNKPVYDQPFKGRGWHARLRIGFAPVSTGEYHEMKLEPPDRGMPYFVSSKNAGIDLIRHDRVIRFHVLEPYFTDTRHGQYNLVRGELDLIDGFRTAITKNAITADHAFEECIAAVREFLDNHDILSKRHSAGHVPENILRDRLYEALKKPPHSKKDVEKEVAVGTLDGHIDVLADGEPYELKSGEATGLDVYQLFAYMDIRGFKKGFLIASGFKPTVQPVLKHIKEKHKMVIQAIETSAYGIDGPLTAAEIDKARAKRS